MYCIYRCFNTQNYIYPFQNLSLGFILKIFLKFRKFQPRYSYKIYSYKKKECIILVIKTESEWNWKRKRSPKNCDRTRRIRLSWPYTNDRSSSVVFIGLCSNRIAWVTITRTFFDLSCWMAEDIIFPTKLFVKENVACLVSVFALVPAF